jgi:hypothetical protein
VKTIIWREVTSQSGFQVQRRGLREIAVVEIKLEQRIKGITQDFC